MGMNANFIADSKGEVARAEANIDGMLADILSGGLEDFEAMIDHMIINIIADDMAKANMQMCGKLLVEDKLPAEIVRVASGNAGLKIAAGALISVADDEKLAALCDEAGERLFSMAKEIQREAFRKAADVALGDDEDLKAKLAAHDALIDIKFIPADVVAEAKAAKAGRLN